MRVPRREPPPGTPKGGMTGRAVDLRRLFVDQPVVFGAAGIGARAGAPTAR